VTDDVMSPCVDTGDPLDAVGGELCPHGGVINMGRYGGTRQASMSASPAGSAADLDCDGSVSLVDFAVLAYDWNRKTTNAPATPDGPPYRGDLDRDGRIDLADLSVFAEAWLTP
jgi:hypothetical protein